MAINKASDDRLSIADLASALDDMSRQLLPDCFLSFIEVAEIIGLDATTIRNGECGTAELLRIKLGARTVFSFNDVQDWIARRVAQARDDRRQKETEADRLAQRKAEALRRKQFVKDSVLTLINGGQK